MIFSVWFRIVSCCLTILGCLVATSVSATTRLPEGSCTLQRVPDHSEQNLNARVVEFVVVQSGTALILPGDFDAMQKLMARRLPSHWHVPGTPFYDPFTGKRVNREIPKLKEEPIMDLKRYSPEWGGGAPNSWFFSHPRATGLISFTTKPDRLDANTFVTRHKGPGFSDPGMRTHSRPLISQYEGFCELKL